MLRDLLDLDIEDAVDAITDGGDDRGVDAIFIDDQRKPTVIHIFQFKTCIKYEKHRE